MPHDVLPTADALLRAREVRGLRVPVLVRLLLFGYALSEIGRFGPPGYTPLALGVLTLIVAANAGFLLLLRDDRRIDLVGWCGVAIDVVFLGVVNVVWLRLAADLGLPVMQFARMPLVLLAATVIVINSLAMRPAWPAAATAGALAAQLVQFAAALRDPRTVWSDDFVSVITEQALNGRVVAKQLAMVTLLGGALTYLAHAARRTLHEAAAQAAANAEIRQAQARLVMRERLGALGRLVAGVSHEMNSPLGVMRSALDTQQRAAAKLAPLVGADARAARALAALDEGGRAGLEAADRLAATLEKLRRFTRLDEADRQRADLHEGLDGALALVPAGVRGGARVVRNYADLPRVLCHAALLNEVFLTLLTNAFEALDGAGTVTVTTAREGDRVRVDIADTGRGLAPERLPRLFDVDFSTDGPRVSAGFGLPASQSVAHQHGGEILVRSAPGAGTTFTLLLPIG